MHNILPHSKNKKERKKRKRKKKMKKKEITQKPTLPENQRFFDTLVLASACPVRHETQDPT